MFALIMNEGSAFMSLTYIAAEKIILGYGGGMSSAKAQRESDTRTLAFEAGRKYGSCVNTISAGPLKSRAASAIGKEPGQKTFIEYAIDYSKANAPPPRTCTATTSVTPVSSFAPHSPILSLESPYMLITTSTTWEWHLIPKR
jgi:enoyl-[acyl-carrier-protein] reductase (NADH)